ncbi:uncharacterized protein PV09_00788 [Verruconis gallopava]|uniref:PH domain-containing protein n=1 Tax=Verruconis gallopava TaxID=253628 RepID=A0A0D2BBW0_9PEZI|nr:uncharacterized protein PV09_00788 [Verruconis gallopava]KIW08864.1 hypothetical protein PV09_00788 [Verruconis gallopava]
MARDDQGRKSGRNFASLRATFSRSTLALNEGLTKEDVRKPAVEEVKPAPKTKQLDRRQSKYTLFDLFSKPKVQTARGYHETGLQPVVEQLPPPPHPLPPPQPPPSKQLHVVEERPKRELETVEPYPTRKPPPPPQQQSLQTSAIEPPARIEQPRTADYWEAIPLSQAYPQAIRHGVLQCPAASVDTLLRLQNLRSQAGFLGSNTSLPSVKENGDSETPQESAKLVSRRFSTLNETPELVNKIFVLMTTGRLVQYTGNGTSDRKPEKVLQLGEKSAAFVCDLIPGKHWVVQVVQHMNAQAAPQINKSRSILSRLRNPVAGRKNATNILLVFRSAEDMHGWLRAIRGIIEKMGGEKKKDDGEAHVVNEESVDAVTEEKLGHRYRISRPTSLISATSSTHRPRSMSSFSRPRSPRSPVDIAVPPVPSNANMPVQNSPSSSPRDASFPAELHSLVGRATSTSPMDSSVASSDQVRLERLREGSRASEISTRASQASDTDHGTIPTSKASSQPPSPQVEIFGDLSSESQQAPCTSDTVASSNTGQLTVASTAPTDTSTIEASTQSPQPSYEDVMSSRLSDILEPKSVEAPVLNSQNPRSRTSEVYSHTLPARLKLLEITEKSNSEIESWDGRSRPDSIVGQLPSITSRSLSRMDSVSNPRRPLSRMLPIRPSDPSAVPPQRSVGPGPVAYPRRYSSLPATKSQSMESSRTTTPVTSNSRENSSSQATAETTMKRLSAPTHRERMPSLPLVINPQPSPPQQASQQVRPLRRPTSLQIRSDPAPFLSQRRPSITSRPSHASTLSNSYFAGSIPSNDFLQSVGPRRASSVGFKPSNAPIARPVVPVAPPSVLASPAPTPAPTTAPPEPPQNPSRPAVRTRTSMPAMMFSGLPPAAPPPSTPLPSLPANVSSPSEPPNVPLPSLPVNMSSPSEPPNMPLPPLPPNVTPPSQRASRPLSSLPPNIPLPPLPTHAVAL